MADVIFALDIGTRNVVGLIAQKDAKILKINAVEIIEHENRSMLDGQIHDVEQVTEVVKEIKSRLEKKTKLKLSSAAVAAAGRALKTAEGQAEREISASAAISREEVFSLELEAIQNAQRLLADKEDDFSSYICVGYSVNESYLDGAKIGNLVSQWGNKISIKVIATFLPRVVVDSLYGVLEGSGLRMAGLTLEPIAASSVVIPSGMRNLNVVLVDIGAGTSDIALSANGSIAGYAMVPMAGDEITEKLCEHFLLDFNSGEKVKRLLGSQEKVAFEDILGIKHVLSTSEILQVILPVTEALTQKIAEKILDLNGNPPQAVILVGGGSLTPQLPEILAEKLSLPSSRVAIRGSEVLKEVNGNLRKLKGPEAVTPIGIAATYSKEQILLFDSVTVNGRPVHLLNFKDITVADALLGAGFAMKHLYGKPGSGLSVSLNGEYHFLKGGFGSPATINVNGKNALLEEKLLPNTAIEIVPAENGKNASGQIKDVVKDLTPRLIIVEGEELTLVPTVVMNGNLVSLENELIDGAEIVVNYYTSLRQILEYLGREDVLEIGVMLNGTAANANSAVPDGAVVTFLKEGSPKSIEKPENKINVFVNSSQIEIPYTFSQQPILTDIFKVFEISKKPPFGKSRMTLKRNNQPATFTTQIFAGDSIEINWE